METNAEHGLIPSVRQLRLPATGGLAPEYDIALIEAVMALRTERQSNLLLVAGAETEFRSTATGFAGVVGTVAGAAETGSGGGCFLVIVSHEGD
jgi:hypothetical protein